MSLLWLAAAASLAGAAAAATWCHRRLDEEVDRLAVGLLRVRDLRASAVEQLVQLRAALDGSSARIGPGDGADPVDGWVDRRPGGSARRPGGPPRRL